jgi:hypothetical protein
VTDEPSEDAKDAPTDENADENAGAPGWNPDPRYLQRNLANRLFPGPSNQMSRQAAERIQGLLRPLDGTAPSTWRDAKTRRPPRDGSRRKPGQGETPAAPVVEPPAAVKPDDVAQLHDTLEQQNELLRAILASTVETQEDARSTAQNSRTFAWAGTAIALLTLIATIISIVAAIRAS